jgi:alpha/beta superfamily hydrolase
MPANLAFLDIHAADRVRQAYPEVERWYIGGHSLGGSAASYCLAAHPDCYEGLVLLAAYTTEDFSSAEIKALSLFGTEDGILNRSDRYDSCRPNLPESTVEIKIEGGCHSYFGCYGMQEGDGVPSITAEEQINFTADAIRDFIFDKDT